MILYTMASDLDQSSAMMDAVHFERRYIKIDLATLHIARIHKCIHRHNPQSRTYI